MGKLIEGRWSTGWYDTDSSGGEFVREDSGFRDRVTADGSSGFKAEAGRYHLYVSLACPWAHRVLIFRKLKGLEEAIGLSVVDPYMGEQGWSFSDGPGCVPDTVNGCTHMHELYVLARPDYSGRVTVPVLWDKREKTIVNNESAELIRMLNSEFDGIGAKPGDYYPEVLRADIDEVNGFVYERINNGVYKCGFATGQDAYEKAFHDLFDALDELERRLQSKRFLCGDRVTEADWRLFTTLLRFDPVYHGHFKCNKRRLVDYPALSRLVSELYRVPGVAETVDFDHIKQHYYRSHHAINPSGIVPLGPDWQP